MKATEQELNAVVTLRNHVSPWLTILQVVPDGWVFPDYLPGQFAVLGLLGLASRCAIAEPENPVAAADKLIKRAYSIASSPVYREFLEFYVALVPGGVLTPRLFDLKIGDRIWLSPKASGKFTCDHSRVFICGSPRMTESMIATLEQEGFKEDTKSEPGQVHVEKYW